MNQDAIDENQVVEFAAKFLMQQNWRIISKCTTSETGIDIVAEKSGQCLLIEAKGLTSALATSRNFGKPYYDQQKRHSIEAAVFAVCEMRSKNPDAFVAIALPEDRVHRQRILAVEPALSALKVDVLWISADGNVRGRIGSHVYA